MDLVAARTPPRERYKILRGECEMHTRGSAMRVQWAGDLEPAARFCCGAGSGRAGALPHAVDYIFGLSTGHPFDITRAPAKNDAGGI